MRKRWTALAVFTTLLACLPGTALGHAGNPNFESRLDGLARPVEGLRVEVLDYDDSLQLVNRSGETVVVYGYEGEPYARIRGDGTVEVNANSPAAYLNEDRFAAVRLPARADPEAAPQWKQVGDDGVFAWHDHRIHWMAAGTPPQVEDEGERTEVFDYRVPIAVAGERDAIAGTLFWVGAGGGSKLPLLIAGAAIVLVGGAAVLILRRRRGAGEAW